MLNMRCLVFIPRGQTIVHLPQSMQLRSMDAASALRPRWRQSMTLRTLIPEYGDAVQVALQLPQAMHMRMSGSRRAALR